MDVSLWAAVVGIVAGAVGYYVATFWIQPILRYRDIRNRVVMEFIYYAQVINAEGLNEEMQALYRERVKSNRKTSAEFSASILDLPWLYLSYLHRRGRRPDHAASHLIGYSNNTDYDEAHKREDAIRRLLGLPPST